MQEQKKKNSNVKTENKNPAVWDLCNEWNWFL